jgi:hypothetical protein
VVKKRVLKEEDEQTMLVKYVQYQYPKVLFKCDMAGVRLSIGSAMKQKRLGNSRAYPDLFFPEPRGKYHGLFIELKRSGTRLIKKNGDCVNEHIAEQIAMLAQLSDRGYYSHIAVGFDEAKTIIDWYLGGEHGKV